MLPGFRYTSIFNRNVNNFSENKRNLKSKMFKEPKWYAHPGEVRLILESKAVIYSSLNSVKCSVSKEQSLT